MQLGSGASATRLQLGEALDTALWKLPRSHDDRLDALEEIEDVFNKLDSSSSAADWGALLSRVHALCEALLSLFVDETDGDPCETCKAIRLVGWLLGEPQLMSRVVLAESLREQMLSCVHALANLGARKASKTRSTALGAIATASATGGMSTIGLLVDKRATIFRALVTGLEQREPPFAWRSCVPHHSLSPSLWHAHPCDCRACALHA